MPVVQKMLRQTKIHQTNPKGLFLGSVDARGKDNRAEQFMVVTTILDTSIDGGQIGGLYERRWDGEVDIRSIKSTMKMDILRRPKRASCTPLRALDAGNAGRDGPPRRRLPFGGNGVWIWNCLWGGEH